MSRGQIPPPGPFRVKSFGEYTWDSDRSVLGESLREWILGLLSIFLPWILGHLSTGLEFPHGHGGHCLPFLKFGYDALRPMSTFSAFFTTSWPWCLFVTLPSGLSATNFQNLKSEACLSRIL